MKKLVRLPKNMQWVEAQQLIEEAGIVIPPCFVGEAIPQPGAVEIFRKATQKTAKVMGYPKLGLLKD